MAKKMIGIALALALCGVAAFGQTAGGGAKPRLGILPFTGGAGGDGETVATLFSFQANIRDAFTVVPRTSAVNAMIAEQRFQTSGYTDSDTISRLGRMLNADFVISGFIRRVGNRNLLITTIVNVETFEQLAGDYREYGVIEEVRPLLTDVAAVIINASRKDTSRLPKLAIMPFNIANAGVNVQEAEALAQILSIEMGNTGRYVVLPRTTAIQAAMKELDYQMSGATAEEGAKALGRAINAQYVLSGEVRSLGAENMFTASILNVEDGSLLEGDYRNYRTLGDGVRLMAELAGALTGTRVAARPVHKPKADPKAAKLKTVGVSVGTTFSAPLLAITARGTFAPWRYSFFELGLDLGMDSAPLHNPSATNVDLGDDERIHVGYFSGYPYARFALFMPFEKKGGLYAGAGCGYMLAFYTFPEGGAFAGTFAADIAAGVNILDIIDVSVSMRMGLGETGFTGTNYKYSAGYTYRFK